MIQKATIQDLNAIQKIVYETISEIYPNYYPQEVVEFFLNHHNEENIVHDLENGDVYLLSNDDEHIGTGTIVENCMNRVFVLPQYQGKGYGTQIMDFLEEKISEKHNSISLDSSLPAFNIYIKRGYKPIEYYENSVENGKVLCYQVMTKDIESDNNSDFNLNDRIFVSTSKTENGEVSNETCFKFHQKGQSIWGSYSGGDIERGTLIGKFIESDQIYFTYQHLNTNGDIRIGECKSRLEKLPDTGLRIYKSWKWLNGNMSYGESIIEELI
ncbi:GNAT family N-acetyltransferase [Parabacteroides sp. Marseille-P3160]|uniref:GNAT family N-acetyltransferase n=1 Tax=Parabacteroides sp. Marseille-P3160 TaxID=1917887 RepID=UPI000B411796|nr:GNAT family N-acetyltransferase [Parabacteroides sp. Marseille-P3160]